MDSSMTVKGCRLGKGLVTHVTFVRTVSGVYPCVYGEIGLTCKHLSANFARNRHLWFDEAVVAFVLVQGGGPLEFLPTYVALEWLVICVNPLMNVDADKGVKCPETYVTPVTRCVAENAFVCCMLTWCFIANIIFERLIRVRFTLVLKCFVWTITFEFLVIWQITSMLVNIANYKMSFVRSLEAQRPMISGFGD